MEQSTINALRETAPLLVNAGPTFASRFYEKLLADHPELNDVFNRGHQQNGSQPRALFMAVCDFVRCADDLSEMGSSIDKMAHKHCACQIQAEHYPIVAKYLLLTMEEVLGDKINDQLLGEWAKALGILNDVLIRREGELYRMTSDPTTGGWERLRSFKIDKKIIETEDVMSFVLVPADGKPVLKQLPGQYLTLHIPPSQFTGNWKQIRHYSISDVANGRSYRISVKRHEAGLISRYLHEVLRVGDTIEATPPFGSFVYSPIVNAVSPQAPLQPLVNFTKRAFHKAKAKMHRKSDLEASKVPFSTMFISSNVGITCLLPMLTAAVAQQEPLLWVHVAKDGRNLLFNSEVDESINKATAYAKRVVWFREASAEDRKEFEQENEKAKENEPENVNKKIGVEKHFGEIELKYLLPDDKAEVKHIQRVFLCGGDAFMREMAGSLIKLGVEVDSIFYENYGPSSALISRPIPVLASMHDVTTTS